MLHTLHKIYISTVYYAYFVFIHDVLFFMLFMIFTNWIEKIVLINTGFCFSQREKDEAVGELDAIKDRFEMAQATQNRVVEEKEHVSKELDRLLEKFDR